MFNWDPETRKITLHRGDTGVVPYVLTGYTLGPNDRVLWTMKDGTGTIVKEGIYTPEDNKFRVEFLNAETDYLSPGLYSYDTRVAINPVFDEQGRIIDGECITTPVSPLIVEILSTVGQI